MLSCGQLPQLQHDSLFLTATPRLDSSHLGTVQWILEATQQEQEQGSASAAAPPGSGP